MSDHKNPCKPPTLGEKILPFHDQEVAFWRYTAKQGDCPLCSANTGVDISRPALIPSCQLSWPDVALVSPSPRPLSKSSDALEYTGCSMQPLVGVANYHSVADQLILAWEEFERWGYMGVPRGLKVG